MSFDLVDYDRLSAFRRSCIDELMTHLTGRRLPKHELSAALSTALELLEDPHDCVPDPHADEEVLLTIRRKFACTYWPALKIAERRLQVQQPTLQLMLAIDPSYEGQSQIVIHDGTFVLCHDREKARQFQFGTLADLAAHVAEVSARIIERYRVLRRTRQL